MNNQYEQKILNYLYDRYEQSVLSKQGSSLNLQIKANIRKIFPKYDNSNFYQERINIDNACQLLKDKELIWITFQDEDINEVGLNLNKEIIKQGYQFINRNYQQDYRQETYDFLNQLSFEKDWINNFINDMKIKLNQFKGVQRYLSIDNIKETQDIFLVLNSLEEQTKEISYRKFSLLVLKDSKRFEQIKRKIVNIIDSYYEVDFQDENDMFSYFNIVKNPSFIYLNGNMTIRLNDQVIDLGKINSPFSLTTENIKSLEILEIKDSHVLTIENLTSFYDTYIKDTLIVYLGGYHNSLRRELLSKIYQFNPKLKFYHFGDIDAGGFYIWLHLCKKTNIPFFKLGMNQKTLIQYQEYTKQLTENDRKRLIDLQSIIQEDVIDYMLENNCKLEQEIIELDENFFDEM